MRNQIFEKKISDSHVLAICLGLVYLWFGLLKFFPGKSPAEQLAQETIALLTFGLIPASISITLLAIWEVLVAALLLIYRWKKLALSLAITHIILTFTPLFILSQKSFVLAPLQPTLLGQYIIKNILFIGVLLVLYRRMQNIKKED
ncbi:doxx family protein [Bacteroidia bacterium]|jgi:uncharacterized membrane protein YphA (DoxX/SURF4 family)|nr:doxx family protein [Bacteroidia bacterium]